MEREDDLAALALWRAGLGRWPSMTVALAGISVVGLLVLLWALGRRNNRAWEDWERVLDAQAVRKYRFLGEQFKWDRDVIEITYADAVTARRHSLEDARRLLDLGYRFLAEVSEDRLRLLDSLAAYSRMISLFVPVAPIRPSRFRLGQLEVLAALGCLVHHFLVSASERFQLRVYVLRLGFKVLLGAMLRSGRRATRSDPDQAWARIEAGRHDLGSLSDETLESVHVFLLSLATVRRRAVAVNSPARS